MNATPTQQESLNERIWATLCDNDCYVHDPDGAVWYEECKKATNAIERLILDEIGKAFDAGRTVKNYKGEWQETYSDDYTSAKYSDKEQYINQLQEQLNKLP